MRFLDNILEKYVDWWVGYPYPKGYDDVSLKERLVDFPCELWGVVNMPFAIYTGLYLKLINDNKK